MNEQRRMLHTHTCTHNTVGFIYACGLLLYTQDIMSNVSRCTELALWVASRLKELHTYYMYCIRQWLHIVQKMCCSLPSTTMHLPKAAALAFLIGCFSVNACEME